MPTNQPTPADLEAENQRLQSRIAALEAERDEARARYQWMEAALEQSHLPICFCAGPDLVYRYANQAYLDCTARPDLLGKPLREVFTDEELPGLLDQVEQVYASGETRSIPAALVRFKPGETGEREERWYDLVFNPVCNPQGEVIGVSLIGVDVTEKQQQAALLHESRETLQLVIDNLPQAVFWKDRDSRYLGCNRRFLEDAGLATPAEVIGKIDDEMPWVEQAEAFRTDDQAVMAEGQPRINYEEPITRADGSRRWLSTSKIPLRRGGAVVGVLGMYEDITERTQQQEELRQSRELLQTFIDNVPANIFAKDRDGKFILINRTLADYFGTTRDAVVGTYTHDYLPPEDAAMVWATEQQVLETGEALTVEEVVRSVGGLIDCLTIKFPITTRHADGSRGEVYAVGGFSMDISERKRQQAELRTFQFAVESAADAIFWLRSDGSFRYVNATACQRLGYSLEEFLTLNISDVDPSQTVDAWPQTWATVKQRGTFVLETAHQHKDGSIFPVEANGAYFEFEGQEMICAFVRDITERTQQQAALRQSEARHRALLEALPDLVFVQRRDGTFLDYQAPSSDLLVPPEEFLGRRTGDVFAPELAQQLMDAIGRALESSTIQVMEYALPMGNAPGHFEARIVSIDAETVMVLVRNVTERKRQEDDLRTFKALIENAPDGFAMSDLQGRLVYANPAYCASLGWEDPPLGETVFDTLAEEPEQLAALMEQLGSGQSWQGELRYRRTDGSIFPGQASSFVVTDAAGTPQVVAGIMRDITERKRQEDDLRLSQFALDNASDMVEWQDTTGRLCYVNDAVCQNLGYTREELLTMTLPDIDPNFPPDQWQSMWNHVKQVGTMTLESLHRRKDGSTFPVEVTTTHLQVQGQEFVLGFVRNITERKQQEDDLRTFKALIENAPDGFAMADLQGHLVYANPAYCATFGWEHPPLGETVINALAEEPEYLAALMQQVLGGQSWQGELRYRRTDGSIFPGQASSFVVYDAAGAPQVMAGIMRDITERKQQEDDLRIFKTVVENAADGIGMANGEGRVVYCNATYGKLTGYGEAVIGMSLDSIYDVEMDQIQAIIQSVMEEGFWRGPLPLRRQDGTIIPAEVAVFPVADQQGALRGTVGIVRDMTEQRRTEAERAALQQKIIDAQRDALRELSTPLIPITDGVVIMPLIGTIDSTRAQMVMETLLEGVARHQAELVILDITGVLVVDTQVAQAFIQAAQAVQLLGARVMLTGIQPQIAQTLVHLGVDLSGIMTRGSLQAGIATALQRA